MTTQYCPTHGPYVGIFCPQCDSHATLIERPAPMPITGKQFIDEPFKRSFWFVAAQLGASEAAIGQITGHAMREIYESNRHVGQVLAFPYHDRRGGGHHFGLQDIQDLWNRWHVEQMELEDKAEITLNHFRLVIDPYLQHDHG